MRIDSTPASVDVVALVLSMADSFPVEFILGQIECLILQWMANDLWIGIELENNLLLKHIIFESHTQPVSFFFFAFVFLVVTLVPCSSAVWQTNLQHKQTLSSNSVYICCCWVCQCQRCFLVTTFVVAVLLVRVSFCVLVVFFFKRK